MPDLPFTAADLKALCQWDTPTICNALEIVAPHRRGHGFSIRPFVCADPALPPICGLARTGRIRAAQPSNRAKADDRAIRIGWYEYVSDSAIPPIAVLEDLDGLPGTGAFWGEVNSNVHKALGVLGCVTSGSIRDLDVIAPGFQLIAGVVNPSHAFVHMVDFAGPVNVHGMSCAHDDVVHADRHGAVVIPRDVVKLLPAAIDLGARKEKVILDLCKEGKLTIASLRDAFAKMEDIH